MKKLLIIFMIVILLGTISGVLYNKFLFTINLEEKSITIQLGESLRDVSNKLKENKIINSSEAFILYTKLKGLENEVSAGHFIIPPQIKFDKLLMMLKNPKNDYAKFTIPEGYSIYQIGQKLEDSKLGNKEEFLRISEEGYDSIITSNNFKDVFYQLEGYLFPDTYYISSHLEEKDIVMIMMDKLNEILTPQYRERADDLGLTINEVLTIASLIEKESANDEERKRISGVIHNRLNRDMALQIDASVIYGITEGKGHINRLLYKDLEYDSVYNTYINKGLPPGPIASPGKASIEAALYPEEHDYLYYVLNKNGTGHLFSKTYREHINNRNNNR